MRPQGVFVIAMLMGLNGCASHPSSLLLERPAKGPMNLIPALAHPVHWTFDEPTQSQVQQQIEISVSYASQPYLEGLFRNRAIFGPYAGPNPYNPVHLVFYVKTANRSDKKVFINPAEFVLVDDLGNQYHTLGQDYVTAFAESRQPVASTTRELLEGARPGYFGISVPVGKFFAQKPVGNFALLLQSALKPGPLFPDSVYDGLIAFWSPPASAKTLRLLVTNVKTDFDAGDVPRQTLEFPFEFHVTSAR